MLITSHSLWEKTEETSRQIAFRTAVLGRETLWKVWVFLHPDVPNHDSKDCPAEKRDPLRSPKMTEEVRSSPKRLRGQPDPASGRRRPKSRPCTHIGRRDVWWTHTHSHKEHIWLVNNATGRQQGNSREFVLKPPKENHHKLGDVLREPDQGARGKGK